MIRLSTFLSILNPLKYFSPKVWFIDYWQLSTKDRMRQRYESIEKKNCPHHLLFEPELNENAVYIFKHNANNVLYDW